jgi:hypothetical protein
LKLDVLLFGSLRNCNKSRKVTGSILNGLIEVLYGLNTSVRTIAVASTKPLTKMSIRNISRGAKAAGA